MLLALFLVAARVHGVALPSSDLKPSTLAQLEVVSQTEPDPRFFDPLVPERNLTKESELVPVPEPVRRHALLWAKRVVKAEWLPANLDQLLVGLRNINQDERGRIPTGWVPDLVIAKYEIRAFRFYLIENGLTLSVRVHFPAGQKIGDENEAVARSLATFLNLDASVLTTSCFITTWRSPLCYGMVEPDEPRPDSKGSLPREWGDSICFASDGGFLFASVREVRDGVWINVKPDWQPVPPDRF